VGVDRRSDSADIIRFFKAEPGEIERLVTEAHAEVIEVKARLGRSVIG
jgi:hypothetical protein